MITIKIHNPEYNSNGEDWLIENVKNDDKDFQKLLKMAKSDFIPGKYIRIYYNGSSTISEDYSIKYKIDEGPWITVYDTEIIKRKVEIEW